MHLQITAIAMSSSRRPIATRRGLKIVRIWLVGMSLAAAAWGEQFSISTYAGGPPLLSIPALNPPLRGATGLAVGTAGSVYFSVGDYPAVYRLDSSGILTRVAGTGIRGYSGDGGPAISAQLDSPNGVAVDNSGNLYIADNGSHWIRKVSTDGIITTVAGTGSSGNGSVLFGVDPSVTVDNSGNLYIADTYNHRVRKVSTNGMITTVAGVGTPGHLGDSGPAISAQLNYPGGVATDRSGNLYIADNGNHWIRKVSTNGIITTVAGTGTPGYSDDGGPAISARLEQVFAIAADSSGNLYIADFYNRRIRKVSTNGIITTVAGTGTQGYSGDGGPATSAQLAAPTDVAVDSSGNLYITEPANDRIRKVSADGIITTVMVGGAGDGGPATSAQLYHPSGVAVDGSGNLYVAEYFGHRIRKVSADGIITTVAGTGVRGYSGDGGPARSAQLDSPDSLVVDTSGNLFVVENSFSAGFDSGQDSTWSRVRKVSPDGIITTVVPTREIVVWGVTVDSSGNLYLAENTGSSGCGVFACGVGVWGYISKVSADGSISRIAGMSEPATLGDDGPAASAGLQQPAGVAVDASGNLYVAEYYGERIRKISADGIITTVGGTGTNGYSGDGGPATNARLNSPIGVATDSTGNLYIADFYNVAIRRVSANGIITTVAVVGSPSSGGEEIPGGVYIAVDCNRGRIFASESFKNRVLLVQALR